jgi:MSHA biogenesis protein MshN
VPPTPVLVAAAPAAAPASDAIALREIMARPVADVTAPMRAATAAPATMTLALASLAPASRAIESPGNASLANASTLSTHVDARIEKRSPTRTARERADAEYQRGVTAHQQDQLAEAASAYTAALREETSFVAARQALAGLMIGEGRANEARTLLTDGLALAPQHAGLAMMLARLQADRGELQRAAEILQATDSASMSAEDHAFRAAVLQRLNRHTEASDHFAAALRTAPNNGVWWMGLAISQAADGRNDTAKEAFNRARSSGSLSPELAQYVEQRLKQL